MSESARRIVLSLLVGTLLAVGGCASKPAREQTEFEIYTEARKNLDHGNFITAQTKLQELETRFPFGRYSEQSQLDMMYAQMRALDYPAAVSTAARFLRQNPGHPQADYALYIKGLGNQWMEGGVLERRSPSNPALRDLSTVREAFNDFSVLVARHPDSPFAPDARARMLFARNLLAEQEVAVGWYYVRRGACTAAISRARYVLENFPTSPAQADALVIAGECSRRVGEQETGDRYVALLKTNFPDHHRLRDDGTLDVPEGRQAVGPSWLHIVTFGLLD